MPASILFIDNDPAGREVALFNLRKVGHEVTAVEDEHGGLSALQRPPSTS
jgi:CheY-like chemotaxis protein